MEKPLLHLKRGSIAFIFALGLFFSGTAKAQGQEHKIDLNTLDAFKPTASGNWQIAGDVQSDRYKNHDLHALSGKGILVNLMTDKKKDNLQTIMEHGDIDLDFDVLMPANSNSGVYFQGRYEIQMLDSWRVKNAKSSDIGGIYQRWDNNKPDGYKGYEGVAPRINAAKAAGLWQHFSISFQAPRFDASGNKISNAKFLKVLLNGQLLHENEELTGPTRGALFTDEKPVGPLFIQGDHGPVAYKNFEYTLFTPTVISVTDLKYALYKTKTEKLPSPGSLKPSAEGSAKEITCKLTDVADEFVLHFSGNINVPVAGNYKILISASGSYSLSLADSVQSVNFSYDDWNPQGKSFNLKAGANKFSLTYGKNNSKRNMRLVMYAEGAGIRRQALHGYSSAPEGSALPNICIPVAPEVQFNRSFTMLNGKVKPYAMAVGTPNLLNYYYNTALGSVMQLWTGPYLNVHGMWHDRGGTQLSFAIGTNVILPDKPTLAILTDKNTAWPDSASYVGNFTFNGYSLDEAFYPMYKYQYKNLSVSDKLVIADEGRKLLRAINVSGAATEPVYCLLAEAKSIISIGNGQYVIDNRNYYLDLETKDAKPEIRKVAGLEQLIVPVGLKEGKGSISWSYAW
jgi:Domain of Unknown Function (DUF1080)